LLEREFSSRLREKNYLSVLYTAAAKTIQKSAKKTAKTTQVLQTTVRRFILFRKSCNRMELATATSWFSTWKRLDKNLRKIVNSQLQEALYQAQCSLTPREETQGRRGTRSLKNTERHNRKMLLTFSNFK
jgi:hypothetical protein